MKAWLLAVAVALGAGCSRPAPDRWISTAAEASGAADRAIAGGHPDEARELLRALVQSKAPRSVAAEDRRAVLQDAYFRLAGIELAAHQASRARAWAEVGLGFGRGTDLFTANLLIAHGRALAALDNLRGAAADYQAALAINEALLAQATEAP